MINEYEFTFNLLTREIKKIYDTKKMEEIEQYEKHMNLNLSRKL